MLLLLLPVVYFFPLNFASEERAKHLWFVFIIEDHFSLSGEQENKDAVVRDRVEWFVACSFGGAEKGAEREDAVL